MFFPYISDCARWLGPCGLVAPDGRAYQRSSLGSMPRKFPHSRTVPLSSM